MNEENVLGVYTICNTLSVILIEIEFGINDRAVYKFSNETKIRRARIYTDKKDRNYFKYGSFNYYLDEFIGGM